MAYYLETNIITIVIAVSLLVLAGKTSFKNETSQLIMNWMLRILILLSISDIAAYCFRQRSYIGMEIANVLYFIFMVLGSYAWFIYICVKTERIKNLKKAILYTCVPGILLCVLILLNPMTGFFFTIDEELLYHRGTGVFLTWIIEWGYLFAALGVNISRFRKEERMYKKSEYRGYLYFVIPMALAAVCQMLFYGTTTVQVGFMVAMLMAYVNRQFFQVQRDDLTGLNNKNAFLMYRDSFAGRGRTSELTIFMMDADEFKTINDSYGHMKGDQALKDIAEVLKSVAGEFSHHRLSLFRYAGDEFVIVGQNLDENEKKQIRFEIIKQLDTVNSNNQLKGEKYRLALSIGYASKICTDIRGFDELLKLSDDVMYQIKRAQKEKNRH